MNTRLARCRSCSNELKPGAAQLWSYHEPFPPGYLCAKCYRIARAYRNSMKRSSADLAAVRAWIAAHVPAAPVLRLVLGVPQYVDQAALCQELLNSTIKSMGLAGPFLATPLLSYLTHLERKEVSLTFFSNVLSIVSEAIENHLYDRLPRTSNHERLNQSAPTDAKPQDN